ASLVAANTPTVIWGRDPEVVEEIASEHRNSRYLRGFALSEKLTASPSLPDVVSSADVLVMAVPSHGFRETLEQAAPYLRPWVPIVSLTKGLERGTHLRMTEIVGEVAPV